MPVADTPRDAPMLSIFSIDLERSRAALFDLERAVPRLAADQEARFERLRSNDVLSAERWRAAHIALRLVLERAAGAAYRRVPYAIGRSGRPSLAACGAAAFGAPAEQFPHFSLSHTGAIALMAVSFAAPVGIDVERPRTLRLSPDTRRRIEAAAQHIAPQFALPDSADARLLQAWVRLEAAAKATGEGIGRLLTEAGALGGATNALAGSTAAGLDVRDLSVDADTFAAVAARTLPVSLPVEALPASAAGLTAFLGAG